MKTLRDARVRWIALLAALSLLAGACSDAKKPEEAHKTPNIEGDGLWHGIEAPELAEAGSDTTTLKRGPKPPPKTDKRALSILEAPTAPAKKPDVAKKPLEVLRTHPAGKIGLEGMISATFNQTMIPLGRVGEVPPEKAPLTISPGVKGHFEWIGTQTIAFVADEPLPFSTTFTATVPKNTLSADGQPLKEAVSFTYETPRLSVESWLPGHSAREVTPDSAILIRFNQPVDAEALRPHLTLKAKGQTIALEAISRDEANARKNLAGLLANEDTWPEDRTVAFAPVSPLPLGARCNLTIGTEAPSAAGPLTPESPTELTFFTYGPMRVERTRCSSTTGKNLTCEHNRIPSITFSNQLLAGEHKKHITIRPELGGDLTVDHYGNRLGLRGNWKPGQRYEITLGAGVEDTHAQKTMAPTTFTATFKDMPSALQFSAQRLFAVESVGPRLLPIKSTNVAQVVFQAAVIKPEQLSKVLDHMSGMYRDNWTPFGLPGLKPTVARTMKPGGQRNEEVRLGVPLGELLGERKTGLIYLVASSPQIKDPYNRKPYRLAVAQVTDIGLSVRYDLEDIYVLVTRLSTGEPLEGVSLTLRDRDGREAWSATTDARGFVKKPGSRTLNNTRTGPFWLEAAQGEDRAVLEINGHGTRGYLSSYRGSHVPPDRSTTIEIFTDRGVYRPGETVHFKGIARMKGARAGVALLPETITEVNVGITDARGQEIRKREKMTLSPFGTFSFSCELSDTVALGHLRLNGNFIVNHQGHRPFNTPSFGHSVRIEEYRAPEFEVKVNVARTHHQFDEPLEGTINARYLFGAPMLGAQVNWTLSRSSSAFTPPDQGDFQFGSALHGRFYDRGFYWGNLSQPAPTHFASGEGSVDDKGQIKVSEILARTWDNPQTGKAEPLEGAYELTLEATATDKNRQVVSGNAKAWVHPAAFYAGLRMDKPMIKAGESLGVSAVAASPAGERLIGQALKVSLVEKATRRKLVREGGRTFYKYDSEETTVESCDLKSEAKPVKCTLKIPRAGYFEVKVEGEDAKGRKAQTTRGIYAYGEGYIPWRQDKGMKVELVSDKPDYKAGDTARILVKSPFKKARGLLTIERSGVITHEVVEIVGSASTIDVPISDALAPNLHVALSLSRGRVEVEGVSAEEAARQDLGAPAFARGSLELKVSLDHKRLKVDVTPKAGTAIPGEEITVEIAVTDVQGNGLESEVALFAVDEGVLSLTGYQTPDPLPTFFHSWNNGTVLSDLRNTLLKREPKLMKAELSNLGLRGTGRGGGGAFKGEEGRDLQQEVSRKGILKVLGATRSPSTGLDGFLLDSGESTGKDKDSSGRFANRGLIGGNFAPVAIQARTTFLTTAYANPTIPTDAQGRATVRFTLPENLTTYRLMAVAVNKGDKMGSGEGAVTVRKPLLVRPSLPRFALIGDSFEAAVVVTNQTGKEALITVGARGTRFDLKGKDRKEVTIAEGQSQEVHFNVTTTSTGPATFQFVARTGAHADAAELQIPIYLPATAEAFATYGTTESSTAQPVKVPKDVLKDHGGLEISLSSTALTGLKDAVHYLDAYPYGCLEQTSSRLLPLALMRDILADFGIEALSSREAQDERAQAGIKRILSMQRGNGGFSYWPGQHRAHDYATVYAVWVLYLAREAGLDVPEQALARGANYLRTNLWWAVRSHSRWVSLTTRAQATLVLALLGERQRSGELMEIYKKRSELPLFSVFHLYGAMRLTDPKGWPDETAELRRLINNSVVEKAGTVHFGERTTHQDLHLVMHSSVRTDAMGLYVLMKVDPDSDLVPKVMRGLMQSRGPHGRWHNTQENAWVLASLSAYYAHYEKVDPDFVTRIWYGEGYLGEEQFKGRQMGSAEATVPMKFLMEAGDQDLVLSREGAGRLYYRVGLRYAPSTIKLPAIDRGYAITRLYEAAPGTPKEDVQRTDEGWRIKAGATIQVTLTITARDRGYYVAVDDPLPAGLEAVNTSFQTTAQTQARKSQLGASTTRRPWYWWWSRHWTDHTEQRDERVQLFADHLDAGTWAYTYLARATTIGTFTLPPTKAEQMYSPENFGRAEMGKVVVRE